MKELLLSLSHFTIFNLAILVFSLFLGIILLVSFLTASTTKSKILSGVFLVATGGMLFFANYHNAEQIDQAIQNHNYTAKRVGNVLVVTGEFEAILSDKLEIFDETTDTISVKKENKIFIIYKNELDNH